MTDRPKQTFTERLAAIQWRRGFDPAWPTDVDWMVDALARIAEIVRQPDPYDGYEGVLHAVRGILEGDE